MIRSAAAVALTIGATCFSDPAGAQQCRSFTFAAFIGMIDGRCSTLLAETPHGQKTYEMLVRAGRAEAALCATTGATTVEALYKLGFMTADGVIDKMAGTTLGSPTNAQTLKKQCTALTRALDQISPQDPLYRWK